MNNNDWFCALEPAHNSHKRKRLKQLIREHGCMWKVVSGPEPMPCFNGDLGVHVESIDGTHRRNVHFGDIWKSEVDEWMFLHEIDLWRVIR
jgi:hypothetical protein